MFSDVLYAVCLIHIPELLNATPQATVDTDIEL